ncbi:LGFP repeat-containing protein [Mycobacterium sp. 2YAF39]|uniref:LGFP repeat-containing protein n=1 Tax=Mycobacterium sp. 2YAF39 TaxID=3233033 RepID=UPI003F99E356
MGGQKSRRRRVIHRVIIGLLAASTTVLLAPDAAAQPDVDANGAITAAWEASGGDGGPLGPRNGDVYPIGEGFGQNFAGGKMFFTPATGAHFVQGAILEKYESLGGPADGDLGFPTIDEGPGRAPDSANVTFSASDKPVIFFTPATGARVVRGPINAAWDKLGGSAGSLGVPSEDETYRDDVVSQKFTGGELSYDLGKKTFTTVPPDLAGQLGDLQFADDPAAAINAARRAAGGALGPLGAAEGAPVPIGKNGLRQNFAGGAIFYTPDTGAHVVTGQVLAKYESVGGPEGDLGFPITSEVDGGLATDSRMSSFAAEDKPIIFWTPEYGAVIVRGAMAAAWDKLDGAKGALGAPVADQTESGDVITQRFSGGVVSWDRSTSEFNTEPGNLASELSGLEVPGQKAPEAPGTSASSDSKGSKWFKFSWWWLLALVPLVALIGVVLLATLLRRRKGEDPFAPDGSYVSDDARFRGDPEHAYGSVGGSERATTDDEYAAAMFGDRYASQGLGSLPHGDDMPSGEDLTPDHAHDDDFTHGDDFAHRDEFGSADDDPWGAPANVEEEEPPAEVDEIEDDEDTDAVDTAPTRVLTIPPVVARDPLTDTGRHARIEIDEPEPRVAFQLPLDDLNEAPDGYPIKANTRSGVYWAPGSAMYEDASAEIWFASEELARVNGFVSDDEPR